MRHYSAWGAYARSKLANVLFTYRLAGMLPRRRNGQLLASRYRRYQAAASRFPFLGGLSTEQGAATPVYLAASPEVEGVTGKYFERKRPLPPITYDQAAHERLWTYSLEAVVGGSEKDQPIPQ